MATAPEWRFDALTGRRVLISPDRAERPLRAGPSCPFCEGHESETPAEMLAYRDAGSPPNGPGWRVRVVPNRYAAVRMDAGESFADEPGALAIGVGLTPVANAPVLRVPGTGVAEVFIECPRHETRFRNLSREQAADVLRAWRDRVRYWGDESSLAFVQVFKNEGPAAGASVEHCHSQLIGIPFVPPEVEAELHHLSLLQDFAGICSYCRWVESGPADDRFVMQSPRFAVFCPTAPRFPGETWVLPKFHIHTFETLADDKLLELADVLLDLLGRLARAFGDPDFNLIVKLPPFPSSDHYHWRIEVLPRTTSTAGWEWGTGLLINTVFPERAAAMLRAA